jgi:hypothetical protein
MDSQQFNEIFIKLFQAFLQFLLSFEQLYFNQSSYNDLESNISFNNFKSINQYLKENPHVNKRNFFSLSNDIQSINMHHKYTYGLNGGRCWNCNDFYSHTCCAGCKKIVEWCDCVYICGYTYPTKQKNQFAKCKYYTNDFNDIVHDCKGMMKNDEFILYVNERDIKPFKSEYLNRQFNCYNCNKDGHISINCNK